MIKKSLVLIATVSLLADTSFANQVSLQKKFARNHILSSSSTLKNGLHENQSNFTGTWQGMCDIDGDKSEELIKLRVVDGELIISHPKNSELIENYPFNEVKTVTYSNKNNFDTVTTRAIKVDENTIKLTRTEIGGAQFAPSDHAQNLYSFLYTFTYAVNNNNLTYFGNAKIYEDNIEQIDMDFKCRFKRVE